MEQNHTVLRRLKYLKLRRKARRGEIFIRRLYKTFRFFFILFIFYGVYRVYNCHYWDVDPEIFKNPTPESVQIDGNSVVSSDKIYRVLSDYNFKSEKIYKINPTEIEKKIEQLVPIKKAYVRRYWFPARFVIMVDELIPVIRIAPSEEAPDTMAYAISGEAITKEYLPLNEEMNVVKILSYGTKNDDYDNWDKDKILNLYNLAMAIKEYSGEEVEYIDLRNPHNAFVKIQSVKLRLGEIDISVFERIKDIHDILPKIKQFAHQVKYVDLSWKESKYLKMEQKQ